MFDTIKNLFTKAVDAIVDYSTEVRRVEVDANLVKEIALGFEKELGLDKEESEDLATQFLWMQNQFMGFGPAAAATLAKKAGQKAFGRVVKDPQARAMSAKALAKLKEIEQKLSLKVTDKPKTWLAKFRPKSWIDIVLAAFVLTQMDVFAWGNEQIADFLDLVGLGNKFRSIYYKKVGEAFTPAQWEDMTLSFHRSGFVNYFEPDTNERLDLTPANTGRMLDILRRKEVARGRTPTREDLTKLLAEYVKKEPTAPKPTPTTPAIPITIEIPTIPSGEIPISPILLKQISNIQELATVARNKGIQFINSIPQRVSFELRRVKFWVDENKKVLRPTPPMYTKLIGEGADEKTQLIQNRIVVLSIYVTTHQNKRVKVYEVPLDFSVADNVVTPPEAGIEAPIEITFPEEKEEEVVAPPAAEVVAPPPPAPISYPTPTPTPTPPAAEVPITPPPVPPVPTPTPTPPRPRFPILMEVYNTGGIGLRMRAMPNLRGYKIATYPDGTKIQKFADAGSADGYTWAKVYTPDGRMGYMAEEYLRQRSTA